ncbi:hypothetical protein BX616_000373 [Lobosporangium transversale]|nr:hypothetical protein BX616_000373 [Lobosporangium transversale]
MDLEPLVTQQLSSAKWKVEYTQHSGHASDLAREFVNEAYDVVVAVGGDGTISQVVHGYMLAKGCSKGCSIGIIPGGTGGDFVRTTKTMEDPAEALNVILNNESTFVDVGHVICSTPESPSVTSERYFINICSVGIRAPRVKFTINEGNQVKDNVRNEELDLYIMAVANGQYLGGNMHIAPDADITDGKVNTLIDSRLYLMYLLAYIFKINCFPSHYLIALTKFDIVCLHNLSLLDAIVKASPALKTGCLMNLPKHQAFTQKGSKVTMYPIDPSSHIYVEADGETAGVLPASWEMIENGCRMILPKAILTD